MFGQTIDSTKLKDESLLLPFKKLSYKKKMANNAKWATECMDFYDFINGTHEDFDKVKRYKDNIDIGVNGRASIKEDYENLYSFKFQNETIKYGIKNVTHYPIVNQIITGYVGEHIKRPFTPVAYDVSGNSVNLKKKKHLALLNEYVNATIVQPIIQSETQKWQMANQVPDLAALEPEQQQQVQQEIDTEISKIMPQEINKYMTKEYKSPSETQAQKILDYLIREQRIKEKADESFEVGLCVGEIYYYVGIRHDKPVFERVNPTYFEWGGSQNTTRCEDGEWAKYTQYLTISEVYNKYGDVFSKADTNKLKSLLGLSGNNGVDDITLANNTLLTINSGNVELHDPKTRPGQLGMAALFSSVAERLGVTAGKLGEIRIRETHFAWKALRKLYKVKKLIGGKTKWLYFDEDYEFSPLAGDIEIKEIWVPEVWQGTKLGVQDAIYINIAPVPYQYKSVEDPWDVKLPYVGQRLNSPDNNTRNSSYVDLGKKWNFQFDVFMARILEKMSTDVGKVLTFMVEAKPDNIPWADWFAMVKYGKLAPTTFKDFMEINNIGNVPIFKAEDLSQAFELAQMIPALQYLQTQTALSMLYNPSRLGQISPYIPVGNNQQNIAQSSNQTEKVFNQHAIILEKALTQLIENARIAFKDYDEPLTWVLDDGSIAELTIDQEMLSRSKLGVFVSTTPTDIESTNNLKGVILELIQNQKLDLKATVDIFYANNKSEMLNLVEDYENRMKQEMAQQQDAAMQQQQAALEKQAEIAKEQDAVKYKMHQETLQTKVATAEIDSEKFAKTLDIDQDGQNDMKEMKDTELEYKKEKDELDRQHELEKIRMQSESDEKSRGDDREFKLKELEIKKQELEIRKLELELAKTQAKNQKSDSKK